MMQPTQNPGLQPGAPPPPQGQPPQGGGGQQPQIMQIDPTMAQHVDPNNPIQMLLLQRIDKFTEQDGQAVMAFTPQQIAALKKVIPEVGFLLDMIHAGQIPGGGVAPAPGGAPMPPAAMAGAGGGAPPAPQGGQPGQAQPPQGAGLRRF